MALTLLLALALSLLPAAGDGPDLTRAGGAVTALAPGAPNLSARSAVLMDVASGMFLYSKNEDERLFPASITKVLTALVVVRHASPDQVITVGASAAGAPGSSADLVAGDRLSVRDLLYGLLLVSGNDAATALAQGLAGSTSAFAGWMNATARSLGATGSHFTNPHGMPDPGHYTTARDMAKIARAALQNAMIAQMVGTKQYTAHAANGRAYVFVNENKLLGQNGVNGVKTGYTTEAGHTYVASATEGGRRLLAVFLADTKSGKYQDALALFTWGFTLYRARAVLAPGQEAGQVQVAGGERFYAPLVAAAPSGVRVRATPWDRVSLVAIAPEVLPAPLARGARVGSLEVRVNGRTVAVYPLLAGVGVPAGRPPGLRAASGGQETDGAGFIRRAWIWLSRLWGARPPRPEMLGSGSP